MSVVSGLRPKMRAALLPRPTLSAAPPPGFITSKKALRAAAAPGEVSASGSATQSGRSLAMICDLCDCMVRWRIGHEGFVWHWGRVKGGESRG